MDPGTCRCHPAGARAGPQPAGLARGARVGRRAAGPGLGARPGPGAAARRRGGVGAESDAHLVRRRRLRPRARPVSLGAAVTLGGALGGPKGRPAPARPGQRGAARSASGNIYRARSSGLARVRQTSARALEASAAARRLAAEYPPSLYRSNLNALSLSRSGSPPRPQPLTRPLPT